MPIDIVVNGYFRSGTTFIWDYIKNELEKNIKNLSIKEPIYRDFRAGDIRHSNADISLAKELLNYKPSHSLNEGLKESIKWYINNVEC